MIQKQNSEISSEELQKVANECFDGTSMDLCGQCPRKYYYAREKKLVKKREAMPLTYGGAIHEFLEEYYLTGDIPKALERFVKTCMRAGSQIPKKITKDIPYSIEYGMQLMVEYTHYYPIKEENAEFEQVKDTDGKPFIEVSFNIDVGVGIYYGRIDRIVRWKQDDKLYVWEHKHTKNILNATYWNKFAINNQISNYLFAASQIMGEEFGGAIINGIRIHPFKRGNIKDLHKRMFDRRITSRSRNQIQDRAKQIQVQIAFIQQARKLGMEAFYQNAPMGCGFAQWRCDYEPICHTNDEKVREMIMNGEYKEFDWTPYNVVKSVEKSIEGSHKMYSLTAEGEGK